MITRAMGEGTLGEIAMPEGRSWPLLAPGFPWGASVPLLVRWHLWVLFRAFGWKEAFSFMSRPRAFVRVRWLALSSVAELGC